MARDHQRGVSRRAAEVPLGARRVRRGRRRELDRPARGGDVVKLYLVKQRLQDATYATLAPTLIVETLFDFVIAGALLIWALAIGVLPTHQFYSRIPTVDWKFFLRHERATAIALAVCSPVAVVGFVWAPRGATRFRARTCGRASRSSATGGASCGA